MDQLTPEPPKYYLLGPGKGTNLARVQDHEYAYLDERGQWIEHPRVMDQVTGYRGDGPIPELTPEEARALLARLGRSAGTEIT